MVNSRSSSTTDSWGSIYTTLSHPYRVVEIDAKALTLLCPTPRLPDFVTDHDRLSLMASMLLNKNITDLLGPDDQHEHTMCPFATSSNSNKNKNSKTLATPSSISQPTLLHPASAPSSSSSLSLPISLPLSLATPSESIRHVTILRSLVGGPTHRPRRVLCAVSVSHDDPPYRRYMVCDATSSGFSSSTSLLSFPIGHAQTGEKKCLGVEIGIKETRLLSLARRHSLPNAVRVTTATRPMAQATNAKTTGTQTTTPVVERNETTSSSSPSFMRDSSPPFPAQGARMHRRCLSGTIPPFLLSSNSSECSTGLPRTDCAGKGCAPPAASHPLPCPTCKLHNNPNVASTVALVPNKELQQQHASAPSMIPMLGVNNKSEQTRGENGTTAITKTMAFVTTLDNQHSSSITVPLQIGNGHVRGPEDGQGSTDARDSPPVTMMQPCFSRPSSLLPLPLSLPNISLGKDEPLSNLPVSQLLLPPPPPSTASTPLTTAPATTINTNTTNTSSSTVMTPRASCSNSSSHTHAQRKGSMHRRYSDNWNDPGVHMVIDHPPFMSPSPSPTPPIFCPSSLMPSTFLVLQVTRFGTVDNAFTLTPPPVQNDGGPYVSSRDQVLFTLAAIENALPGSTSSPSSSTQPPFGSSFSSHYSASSSFFTLDQHERDMYLSTFRAEAVVGGGSFLGQTDAQIRNSVATSIMATVHTDDVRVLCAGLDRVCKDQMATWQIRWNVQGTKKIVSRRQEQSPHSGSKLLAQYDHYKEFLDRPTMGRMFEYQGDWFEEWQDPTALAISSSTDDGYNYDELNDDEGEYRWTEMTGVAGEGSLLTLVVRPMTDEDFFEEEEAYSSTHIAVDGRTKSSDSISSSVSYYQYGQHEEHAHRYQKKQQRRRELMAREEGLSWVNNQFGGPMRPLTDSVPSPAFTPQHERRRRQSISGVSSSSISSMCSSTSFSMIPFGPRDHELALYQRRYSRAGSSYSETGYSEYEGSDEGMRQHYYVLEQMARPEIPRSLHLPDAFSHFRQDSHGQTRRMSTLSLSYEIKSPTNRTMSTCSSVMVHHLPPHQQPLYSGIGEASMTAMTATVGTATTTTATNSTSGWQVTSLPSVMSLPSRTLPPWTVLSTIALEAWQMWIQTIHAGQDQFQEWCEYVIDLAVDQTIENFMTAYRVVGWIAESRAFLVIKSSSALMIFTPSSSKGPTRGGEAIQRSTQRSPRYSGARASLPAVSRRNSMSVSRTDSTTWPPRKMRLKSSQEWLRRHQQQVKRRRQSLHLQGGTGMGDASILEEMREEDEEYEGDDVYDEDQVHNMSLFAIGEQSASSTISTTATTVSKQSPSRPGLHRRHWSANNVPQLPTSKSLLFEDTDPSHSLTTVMTTTKASGMERAGKLLGQVPVVGRVTRFVGASWVGKKIKGRLELQQDRIDEVLDQVVDWLEVAANTLPVVGNGSLRTSITTVTFSTITNRG